jgi:hypothetical protein
LIFTRRGIEIDKYPAILKHLEQYKERLIPRPKGNTDKNWSGRKAGTYQWYEIQDAVDYYEEFEKPKIIVPAIVKGASYAYDKSKFYSNDKTTIIPTYDLTLLAQLNSKVIDFFFKSIASTKQNGYFEYKPVYLNQLPIIPGIEKELSPLVDQILQGKSDLTGELEKNIDDIMYAVYEINEKERELVENSIF